MANYKCPLCGKLMERDLITFLNHADQHVIDQIKEEHPEWVAADGVCKPCAEYYRKQMSGEPGTENIGPKGRKRRFVIGWIMLALSFGLALALILRGTGGPSLRLVLFLPAFFGMLCLIQAREGTCAVLAELGLLDMDSGEVKIDNNVVARRLKARGRIILVKSAVWAAILTGLFFLFP